MANLKAVVRKKRSDGLYLVYIRIIHQRKVGYIKTDKVVSPKYLDANGEILDPIVNEYCAKKILAYVDLLNRNDLSAFTLPEVIRYLKSDTVVENFSDYANLHISRLINNGQERTAKNYRLAVNHLERYLGTTNVSFKQMSSAVLRKWIESMSDTNRAKEMYPVCVRQIFKAALLELNDEERGIIRVKNNPWLKVQIPKSDRAAQKAISAEACRDFFNRPLPKSKMISSLPELGRDVAMLVLCLGGINTVDLFNMKKENFQKGVIHYNRAKTKHSRSDEAYMEMRVEPFIKPIFEKYLSDEDDEYLFTFHNRYLHSDSFNANANSGIKLICKDMGMPEDEYYCIYTFRHTWGTIAQNDCGANLSDVAFGMNHSHGFKVTRGYVKLDFTPAWNLNAKIIDFIFFSDAPSKQGLAQDLNQSGEKLFRISKKMLIHARAYFKGRVVAELKDIGYSNVDSVIDELAHRLRTDIPKGCSVQFRIVNCDHQTEVVYGRTKGKRLLIKFDCVQTFVCDFCNCGGRSYYWYFVFTNSH